MVHDVQKQSLSQISVQNTGQRRTRITIRAEGLKMEVVGVGIEVDNDGVDKKKKSYAGIPEAAFVVSK